LNGPRSGRRGCPLTGNAGCPGCRRAESASSLRGDSAFPCRVDFHVESTPVQTVVRSRGLANSNVNFVGGLYCNGSGSGHECSPTLSSVTFSGNSASSIVGYGGAKENDGDCGDTLGTSAPILVNVIAWHDSARYVADEKLGGAIWNGSAGRLARTDGSRLSDSCAKLPTVSQRAHVVTNNHGQALPSALPDSARRSARSRPLIAPCSGSCASRGLRRETARIRQVHCAA
jgi:hypothetical protein